MVPERNYPVRASGSGKLYSVPLIEIYGDNRLLIEHHMGISCYTDKEILIKVRKGYIVICGDKLDLRKMSKDKLVVAGRICTVKLHGIKKNEAD